MTKSKEKSTESKMYLLLILLIFVWGLSWPVNKIGLQYMPPLWFAASRLVIATITMFCIVAAFGKLILPTKQCLKIIIVIGILQVGLFMMLINIGLFYVDAGRSAILVYTTPLWVVPISILFFKEEATFLKLLGFCFGLIGILILFNPFAINWSNHGELIGNGVLLLAAFCWAIAILCARHMKWSHTPFQLIAWQLLVGTIPVVIIALIKEPITHIVWSHSLIFSMIYCGVLATAFAYWGTVVISKELSPVTTSLSLLSIPIVGLIFSALMLHEKVTLTIVIAMLFTLSGLLCVIIKRNG